MCRVGHRMNYKLMFSIFLPERAAIYFQPSWLNSQPKHCQDLIRVLSCAPLPLKISFCRCIWQQFLGRNCTMSRKYYVWLITHHSTTVICQRGNICPKQSKEEPIATKVSHERPHVISHWFVASIPIADWDPRPVWWGVSQPCYLTHMWRDHTDTSSQFKKVPVITIGGLALLLRGPF